MPATVSDFMKAAADSGILTADSLEEFLRGVEPGADASMLAQRLVAAGRLTSFQASSICGGGAPSLVIGPYVVLDLLGSGGMGVVYKAEHRTMRRIVALKVIAPTVLQSPAAVRRFAREVQATARLDHPNIVTAFDAGEIDGVHYLVMQCVEGKTLAEIVREAGPQPVERVVGWVVQAARGLAFAHEQGVVHRDVKPGNLLVDTRGAVKILDMGLASLGSLDPPRDQLTASGQIMGTVDYMAPEQAMDTRHADARSDVYSLGVTLWYLLTGRLLFTGETAVNRMMAHIHAPPPTLGSVCGPLPPGLEAVFQRMVAKNPSDRFQSMQDVIASLERIRGPESRPVSKPSLVHLALAIGAVGVLLVVGFLVVPRTRRHDQATMVHADASASGAADRSMARAASGNGATVAPASTQPMRPTPAAAPFDAAQARGHQEAWARHLGIEVETTNSIGQTLVVIPPGTFTMGEGPGTVEVTLTKPFLLGQTEVTQGQWREVMGTDPCTGKLYVIVHDDAAVTYVTWPDAVAFCEKLTARERASGAPGRDREYRLPTSAEWEFACRAGTESSFSFGNDETLLGTYAWYGNGWDAGAELPIAGGNTAREQYAHAVRLKQPNAWRLFDIHGNVFEWVESRRSPRVAEAPATSPSATHEHETCRGGSWLLGPLQSRSAFQKQHKAAGVSGDLGFRIAVTLDVAADAASEASSRARKP